MQKLRKRTLSIFLAVMMATTMLVALPAKALAAVPGTVASGEVYVVQSGDIGDITVESGGVVAGYWNLYGTITVESGGILTWDTSVTATTPTPASGTLLVGGAGAFIQLVSGTLDVEANGTNITNFGLEGDANINAIGGNPFVLDADTGFMVNSFATLTVNPSTGLTMNLFGAGSVINVTGDGTLVVKEGARVVLGNDAVIDSDFGVVVDQTTTSDTGILDSLWIKIAPTGSGGGIYTGGVSAPTPICAIGPTTYGTLADALSAAHSGDTITFLTDIEEDITVTVSSGQELTIDLDGYNWGALFFNGIYVDGGILTITNGGTVTYPIEVANGGKLFFTADLYNLYGISVYGAGSTANVVGDIDAARYGLSAWDEGVITATGDVTVDGACDKAINAESGAIITVNGNVSATGPVSIGVYAGDTVGTVGATVIINGNVTSENIGAWAEWGSKITIDGTLTAPIYISFGKLDRHDGKGEVTINLTAADFDATSSKPGFLQYSITYQDPQGKILTDTIWVRDPNFNNNDDDNIVPATGDTLTLIVGASVLILMLMGAGALLYSRRRTKSIL